jgi:hypothetical protein
VWMTIPLFIPTFISIIGDSSVLQCGAIYSYEGA